MKNGAPPANQSRNGNFHASSFLQRNNAEFIRQLYIRYSNNPHSVDDEWSRLFAELGDDVADIRQESDGPSWARKDWPASVDAGFSEAFNWNLEESVEDLRTKIQLRTPGTPGSAVHESHVQQAVLDSIRALMLIRSFRIRGHLAADLDPLGMRDTGGHDELDPGFYGFSESDMNRPIFLDNVLGLDTATMRQIMGIVRRTYCGTFALQYMHISDPSEAAWLKERIEGYGKEIAFTKRGRKAILNKLVQAEEFEKFLHVKHTGTKRFGLDGGEALIPAMEQIIKRGGALGVREIVIGMPHRGRLNVLANVMGKPFKAIFNEFQGGNFKPNEVEGSGDVKYHLGASSDREFDNNVVHLSLTANPSHLEAVNPVVLGKVRAKQEQLKDETRKTVLPILLHGDAAFAGQGVVAECFGLSGLRGHKTGGTIHIVINNQIGFTTAPRNSRSSPYPTDIALMVEAPIFHVNGDDPEAVVHAARVATEFRQKFGKDVVIDIFCYRRFGHNEGDEPMFTQPIMYSRIKQHQTTLSLYTDRLVRDGMMSVGEIEDMKSTFREHLDQEFEASRGYKPNKADWLDGRWSHLDRKDDVYQRGTTGVDAPTIVEIGKAVTRIPGRFRPHRTVERILRSRRESIEDGVAIDWATAEALAFGSLLIEGSPVRLSGQDCTRGTFSQRHSGIIDQDTEERFLPLNRIRAEQAQFEVIDSMLSEYAVLGYEYGYSLAEPNALTVWEAQFGDFANGAQIMIDQFVSAGESKWLRMSGLVMLLPHGFEGQGPEHSSARLERFLQLCAEDNWIVANCTTPANYFHVLRRQMYRNFRKPLVIMTPKSLLRHRMAVSAIDDFTTGSSFHRVLWDDAEKGHSDTKLVADSRIRRCILCSGKVYFDLLAERDARAIKDIYIMRIEQLYPVPAMSLTSELGRFKKADFVWCQEEPKNQGAWNFIEPNLEWILNRCGASHTRPVYIGRRASASPATGLAKKHQSEQEALVDRALTINGNQR